MGFLSTPRARRWALAGGAGAAVSVVVAASCVMFDSMLARPSDGRSFDHRVHVVEEELECFMCHLGAEDAESPGMPAAGQCRLCHDEPEDGEEDPVAGLFGEGGVFAHTPFSALADEVVFSHLGHVEAGVDCASCHGDVTADDRLGPSTGVSMSECMDCHRETGAPNECGDCHSVISRDWAPPTHDVGWTAAHGPASFARESELASQCSLCHERSSCTACHLDNPPDDHTNYWRRRGHGISAALDRARCATCHRRDSCQECHDLMQPTSHVGLWGGTRSAHCGSCHLPTSREEGCFLCHQGTPSHALATPLPPDHVPGMNCRQCHGLTAPLPHVDNGDTCAACHK